MPIFQFAPSSHTQPASSNGFHYENHIDQLTFPRHSQLLEEEANLIMSVDEVRGPSTSSGKVSQEGIEEGSIMEGQ